MFSVDHRFTAIIGRFFAFSSVFPTQKLFLYISKTSHTNPELNKSCFIVNSITTEMIVLGFFAGVSFTVFTPKTQCLRLFFF